MTYAWMKWQGYSYVVKIIFINQEDGTCNVEIGNVCIVEVPFNCLQAINGLSLPWDEK